MTALNIVRFRVKPGHEEHFIAAHRGRRLGLHGFRGGALVKTGERSYCIVGEWTSTTLADLFMRRFLADPSSAVRASLRRQSSDERDDGVTHGW